MLTATPRLSSPRLSSSQCHRWCCETTVLCCETTRRSLPWESRCSLPKEDRSLKKDHGSLLWLRNCIDLVSSPLIRVFTFFFCALLLCSAFSPCSLHYFLFFFFRNQTRPPDLIHPSITGSVRVWLYSQKNAEPELTQPFFITSVRFSISPKPDPWTALKLSSFCLEKSVTELMLSFFKNLFCKTLL